jgi:hypothetical protein
MNNLHMARRRPWQPVKKWLFEPVGSPCQYVNQQAQIMINVQNDHNQEAPWVPMAKDMAKAFPVDRPFTEIEAMFSLQLDHNNRREVSITGYSKVWGWSTKRVRNFLRKAGILISYPLDTSKVQRQTGRLTPLKEGTDQRTDKELMTFIDFKNLEGKGNRKGTDKGTQLTRNIEKEKKDSAKDPRIKVFIDWFCTKYKLNFRRSYRIANGSQTGGQVKQLLRAFSFEDLQYLTIEFLLDEDPFLTEKAGHSVGMLLKKANQNVYEKYLTSDFREANKGHIIRKDGTLKYP